MTSFSFRQAARLPAWTALLLVGACSTSPDSTARFPAALPPVASHVAPPPKPVEPDLLTQLAAVAPGADRNVLRQALAARQCAVASGAVGDPKRLAVIDYSLPSTVPRMWVFDLSVPKLLHVEHVAHGQGSGGNFATAFSNEDGSHQSSLGLFVAAETYVGENGYSLRMDGLEPGINHHARERLIVIHGADYVDPDRATKQGRLGRSWGCPALRRAVANGVIDSLKDGQLVFAYYPDPHWLGASRMLNCAAAAHATATAALPAEKSGTRG